MLLIVPKQFVIVTVWRRGLANVCATHLAATAYTTAGAVSLGIKAPAPVHAHHKRTWSCTHQQCLIVPTCSYPHSIAKRFSTNSTTTAKLPTDKMSSVSRIRQNYHDESEAGVNKQINLELYASYVYQQLVRQFLDLITHN